MSELEKLFKEFECKRCGNCCKTYNILLEIELEEWNEILKFIESNYNGIIEIMDDSDEFKTITTKEIKDTIELYMKNGSYSELEELDVFWTLDSGICPFIKKNREDEFYCEIQKIKPKLCRNYRCDLENKDFQIYLEQLKKGEEVLRDHIKAHKFIADQGTEIVIMDKWIEHLDNALEKLDGSPESPTEIKIKRERGGKKDGKKNRGFL